MNVDTFQNKHLINSKWCVVLKSHRYGNIEGYFQRATVMGQGTFLFTLAIKIENRVLKFA